jgi:hypothetical protein
MGVRLCVICDVVDAGKLPWSDPIAFHNKSSSSRTELCGGWPPLCTNYKLVLSGKARHPVGVVDCMRPWFHRYLRNLAMLYCLT